AIRSSQGQHASSDSMQLLLSYLLLVVGVDACMKMIPDPDEKLPSVCDTCSSATRLACPSGFTDCDFTLLRKSTNEALCSVHLCSDGELLADDGFGPVAVQGGKVVCNRNGNWKSPTGRTFGSLRMKATCGFRCAECANALTNNGMTCPMARVCRPVTEQCKKAVCADGVMKANPGNVVVQSLSCNAMAKWTDSLGETFTAAQCEAGCTCPALPIPVTPYPSAHGNSLGTDANGCSILETKCFPNERYRLVTSKGIITLESPAGRTQQMTCVDGTWRTTINGEEVVVHEQACYADYGCLFCPAIIEGPRVVAKIRYHPTTWCKHYVLSGCGRGYRVGTELISNVLTCDMQLRWTSAGYTGPVAEPITVDCRLS
uniref:Sushi domain-containing protein n=1 Tax=Haemonchus contortus TaxID=6289 RepID=A0A7I4XUK2_HAECO